MQGRPSETQSANPEPGTLNTETDAAYTFRFDNAGLAEILTLYSDLSRRTVIHAPGLPQGPVSVDVKTPLTKAEALLTLETLLYANGVSLTPVGQKLVKAFPNGSILREGLPIRTTDGTSNAQLSTSNVEDGMEGDRITAQIIPLKHIDVSDPSIIPTLTHFIHQPGGSIIPLHRANSLLVVETTLNLKRLLQILETLDQPTEDRMEVKYYELRNVEASKMAGMLQGMIAGMGTEGKRMEDGGSKIAGPVRRTGLVARSESGASRKDAKSPSEAATQSSALSPQSLISGRVTMHSDDRTNTLIIFTKPSNFPFLDELIDVLDRTVAPEVQFRAFLLQHSKVQRVMELLSAITGRATQPVILREPYTATEARRHGAERKEDGRSRMEDGKKEAPTRKPEEQMPSTTTTTTAESPTTNNQLPITDYALSPLCRVIPDPEQGAILVLGTAHDLQLIERIMPQIDRAIVQVLIESVIVEVNLGSTTDFGIDLLQRQWTKNGVTGAGVSIPSGSFGFPGKSPGSITDPGKLGGNALSRGLNYWLSFHGLDLEAAIHSLGLSSNFRVLQTPMIQSSQNQKARVFIGETRPIITSSVTGVTTGNGQTVPVVSAISQYEIGVTLEIVPVITPGGLVMLDVSQSVEDVTGEVKIDDNEQPIIARRELSSNVSVRDGGVVVLGGLIRNDRTKAESKVPVLGDVPVLGMAFKQTTWRKNRSELVVLIRPTVMRTPEAAQEEAQKLREDFKGLEQLPADKLPPLPQDPETSANKPRYSPLPAPKGW